MPIEFPRSSKIHIIKVSTLDEKKKSDSLSGQITSPKKIGRKELIKERAYSVDNVRPKYKEAYKPWTKELDDELTIMYCEGVNPRDMAKYFGRTKGAINSRITKLELEDIYG